MLHVASDLRTVLSQFGTVAISRRFCHDPLIRFVARNRTIYFICGAIFQDRLWFTFVQ